MIYGKKTEHTCNYKDNKNILSDDTAMIYWICQREEN